MRGIRLQFLGLRTKDQSMVTARAMPRGINPKLTEEFLLSMTDVADASVFWLDGDLRASVTVIDDDLLGVADIQKLCMDELGLHQTPRSITLYRAKNRAA